MTKQEYLNKARDLLNSKYPDIKFEEKEDNFSLTDNTRNLMFFMTTPFEKSAKNDFSNWEDDLLDYYTGSMEHYDNPKQMDWNSIKKDVYPQIKTSQQFKSFYDSAGDEVQDRVVLKPFLDDLVIGCVIDYEQSFAYITEKNMEEINISQDELHKTALENLTNLPATDSGLVLSEFEDGSKIISWDTQDSYDAARLLLPDFYNRISEFLGETFIIGIPCRDLLIATTPEYEQRLRGIIAEVYPKDSHPITDKVILVEKGQFRVL